MREGLFCDLFGCFDNRSCSDAKVIDEFVRFSAVWDCANGKLMHLDALGSDRAKHSIPKTAVRIVIFNGEDAPLCGSGAVQQRGAVDRDDTVEIDDPHGDTGCFQYVIGLQGLEERDASRNNRKDIRCALANDF